MNTPRDFSTKTPPGKGMATQGLPAPQGVKRGRGQGALSPPKAGNPAFSYIGPWLILPLALVAWGVLFALIWAVLRLFGIGGA